MPLLMACALLLGPIAVAQQPGAAPVDVSGTVSQGALAFSGQDIRVYPGVLEPQMAVSLAIARHPEILGAVALIARREAEVALAKSDRWPTIQYGLGPGYGRSYGLADNEWAVRGNLGIDQPLVDFGLTSARIRAAKNMQEAAQANRLDTVEKVAEATLSAYVDAVVAQERLVASQGAITAMQQVQQRIDQRTQAGLSDRSDLNAANIAVQRAGIDAEQSTTAVDAAVSRLIELIGVAPTRLAPLQQVHDLVANRRRGTPDFEQTPVIQMAHHSLDAAEDSVKAARAQRYPTIGVGVNRTFSTGQASANDATWYGLSVRGGISLGGAARQRVAAANAERAAAEQELEARRLEVRTGWLVAAREEEGARRRLNDLRGVSSLWLQTRDLYWQEYILDKRALGDVINAEREIHSAEAEQIVATGDAATAAMRALVLQGELVGLLQREAPDTGN
ncbi:MAG: TolC family protein [Nevskiaceae bacterium]|nr:TolC family protein [Nevskiaceae bacterium]